MQGERKETFKSLLLKQKFAETFDAESLVLFLILILILISIYFYFIFIYLFIYFLKYKRKVWVGYLIALFSKFGN